MWYVLDLKKWLRQNVSIFKVFLNNRVEIHDAPKIVNVIYGHPLLRESIFTYIMMSLVPICIVCGTTNGRDLTPLTPIFITS